MAISAGKFILTMMEPEDVFHSPHPPVRSLPIDILKRYEKWKDVVSISGPQGLKLIKGFHDESLKGERTDHRSSRLGKQYRVIYRIEKDEILVQIDVSVGESVRIIRELQDMSQNELARLTGIPKSTISAIENDRVSLGVERTKQLAVALKCHPSVLVFPGWDINNAA